VAIEFIAFTGDSRITGQIRLADDRLSDMLNAVARVVVRGASVEDIDLARTMTDDLTISCGDLVAVVGTGRRGLENLRKRTVQRRIEMGLGRYVVTGALHVPVPADPSALAGDPAELLTDRDVLVPLTDATIRYERHGIEVVEEFETIIFNRARAGWIDSPDAAPADALIGAKPAAAVAPSRARSERLARSRYAFAKVL
jgi:hypothetical protein